MIRYGNKKGSIIIVTFLRSQGSTVELFHHRKSKTKLLSDDNCLVPFPISPCTESCLSFPLHNTAYQHDHAKLTFPETNLFLPEVIQTNLNLHPLLRVRFPDRLTCWINDWRAEISKLSMLECRATPPTTQLYEYDKYSTLLTRASAKLMQV